MSHTAAPPFPRAPLFGAAILIAASISAALTVRLTGVGGFEVPNARAVVERDLRFLDRPDGSIAVLDAGSGRQVDSVAPGTNGFVRGTLRGLARERHRESVGADIPFRLIGWSDGRLTLEDPATGRRIELESFGPTNAGAFAQILKADGGAS